MAPGSLRRIRRRSTDEGLEVLVTHEGDLTVQASIDGRGLSHWVLSAYDGLVISPDGINWTGIVDGPLPVAAASDWVVLPSCGAVVVFSGTARDHSSGRPDVDRLEYEAYEEQVVPRLDALIDAARTRWPDIGRMALIHRIGHVPVTESAVIVAVSSPHRDTSFQAARFGIDTLKATVPIWKKERWDGGESWGLEPQHLEEIAAAEAGQDRGAQS